MGYALEPKCLECGHTWPSVTVGDAKHFVCVCPSCSNIVNPTRDGFRYAIADCPICGARLDDDLKIDISKTPVDYDGTTGSHVDCPRCENGKLNFRSVMHFSMLRSDLAPDVGEVVNGKIVDDRLRVPGMLLFTATPVYTDVPSDHGGRVMELMTDAVEWDDDSVIAIAFRFMRFL